MDEDEEFFAPTEYTDLECIFGFTIGADLWSLKYYIEDIIDYIDRARQEQSNRADHDEGAPNDQNLAKSSWITLSAHIYKSSIMMMFSVFEKDIDIICDWLTDKKRIGLKRRDLAGGILTSTQKFLETFGHFHKVFECEEWQDLVGIYDVRNVFIHGGGSIGKAKLWSKKNLNRLHDKKIGLNLRDRIPGLVHSNEDIFINSKFCLFSLNTITSFFNRLEKACSEIDAGLRAAK